MQFRGYFPVLEQEVRRDVGATSVPFIEQAMSDLTEIAYKEGNGLDVMVRTVGNENVTKRGLQIAIADEKSNMWFDFIRYGKMRNNQHVKACVLIEDVPDFWKNDNIWSKRVCDTAKSLIETFKKCRENPSMFEYFSHIYK